MADLARLLAVDTSFPPGDGYGAMADLAAELVAPLGFATRRLSVPEALWSTAAGGAVGERVNLIAARGSGLPACSLYFHVDTVPAGEGWTRPPFALTRDQDRLYGRGAADMKGDDRRDARGAAGTRSDGFAAALRTATAVLHR